MLNDEGKKVWGYVFPDGAIPVRNVVPFQATLGDHDEDVYLVDWEALTGEEQDLILEHLKNRFGDSVDAVRREILKSGLPLRAKYVSCTIFPAYLVS